MRKIVHVRSTNKGIDSKYHLKTNVDHLSKQLVQVQKRIDQPNPNIRNCIAFFLDLSQPLQNCQFFQVFTSNDFSPQPLVKNHLPQTFHSQCLSSPENVLNTPAAKHLWLGKFFPSQKMNTPFNKVENYEPDQRKLKSTLFV